MAAAEVEPLEPLKYKTWVLKVSIHCEGCKRKVKKVLHNVEGVFTVNVDAKQQKVTVVGDVEEENLINKLIKSGKHAELWPKKADQKGKKSGKAKNKEKQNDPESGEEADHGGDKATMPTVKFDGGQESAKNSEVAAKNSERGGAKVGEGAGKTSIGVQFLQEAKSEQKKPDTGPASNQLPPAADKRGGETDNGAAEKPTGGSGGGNGGKTKKKKGQNGNAAEGKQASPASPNQNAGPPQVSALAHHSAPRHPIPGYQFPLHYYSPPPVYDVSYDTAQPSGGSTASYYASPPPYAYAYSYTGLEVEPPRSDLDSYSRQPLDSFEMFSDENPNGCSIM